MPERQDPVTDSDLLQRLRRTEQELESALRQLDHASRLATLGTLTAGVAHEINNILTPVLAYAQMASNNPGDLNLQAKSIQKSIHGVETATKITHAMLGFASDPHEPETANVLQVLRGALDCVGRDPVKDRIKVTIDIDPSLSVRMRPLGLQQVLVNLIINATTAMKRHSAAIRADARSSAPNHEIRSVKNVSRGRGGSECELTISAVQSDADSVSIFVSDTGPGIPDDIAHRLFEPFVTGSRRSSTDENRGANHGTGLGLAICRRLIDAAGGTIAVESKPGDGTRFTIKLPRHAVHRAKAV